jgi:GAF domain-containing protein
MTLNSLLPADEPARLRSLRYHAILGSLHEAAFSELVRLTAQIFSLPISLITLVEADEAVYIANQGLAGHERQPRAEAICALAVRQNNAVVFADLTEAAQQAQLTAAAAAAAQQREVQFYAGVPLRMPDRRMIGTLCVLDRRPRAFSAAEQAVLERVSDLVAQTIVVRHHCLVEGSGNDHWQAVQRLLVEQVGEITSLVRYLVARFGVQVPVPEDVLSLVTRRLDEVRVLLRDHHLGQDPPPIA